ncbi:MAG: aminoacetone oxidase family FAD-binding enzyme, partial [Mailhella sp.]|nr:aminoacetone oxidase family FAD-binding enzyme [Mailhella sp.]
MIYDAAIIGAGPAGLLCARNAARRGLRVALIDSHENPGVKLAIAGGGKGNISNRILAENRYVGEDTGILRSALKSFSCDDALELMRELGLPWEERDFGQIFGLKSAAIMAERLAIQCDDAGVDFYLGSTAKSISLPDTGEAEGGPAFGRNGRREHFTLFAGQAKVTARQLVVAAGSPACPQLGANDQLLKLAASWGHEVVPFRPVLVPLVMPENWPLAGLEGISLNVRLGLKSGSELRWPDPEGIRSLLFTHRGVSGPAVLVASCWWKPGMELVMDFLPELPMLELLNEKESGKLIVRNLLARRLPARLADALCPEDLARRKVAELGKKDRLRLADLVHRFTVLPAGTEGMRRAEAAAGGIAL